MKSKENNEKSFKQVNITINTQLYDKTIEVVDSIYGGRISKYIEELIYKDMNNNEDIYQQIIQLRKQLQ